MSIRKIQNPFGCLVLKYMFRDNWSQAVYRCFLLGISSIIIFRSSLKQIDPLMEPISGLGSLRMVAAHHTVKDPMVVHVNPTKRYTP